VTRCRTDEIVYSYSLKIDFGVSIGMVLSRGGGVAAIISGFVNHIHRVGRTGRAEMTGEAFTFFSPQEEPDIKAIERAIGRKLPRVTIEGFDYSAKPQQRLEIPIAERIAGIRKKKAEDRARSAAKAARKGAQPAKTSDSSPYRASESDSKRRGGNRRRRRR